MELFTLRQHINSVAPLEPGALWGVLHNLGQVWPAFTKKGTFMASIVSHSSEPDHCTP